MSLHRQHYLEANTDRAKRQREDRIHACVGNIIAAAIVIVVALGAAGNYLRNSQRATATVVTPVPMPVLVSTEEARVQGYQAGFSAGLAQGCSATVLSAPMATE